jgi:hypothetical protein
MILIIQKDIANIDYYNPKDGSVVNFRFYKNATAYWSPRAGFNWDITGDKTKQLRGGTGILLEDFFVWIGNQVGFRSFFFQVVRPDFKFPQVWRTSLGYDHKFDSNLYCFW